MAIFRRPDPLPVRGAEFRFSQTEDGGEHDGVEEPDGENGPHGGVTAQEHGGSDQRTSGNRAQGKQISGLNRRKSGAPRKRPIMAPPQ